jgi:hypothetical protein
MATGQMQGGGVFAWPDVPSLGYENWAEMSGMAPGHALVGGSAGSPGYGAGQRQVAVAQADPMASVAAGAPARGHWSELMNLKGNPIGWVLIVLLGYMALTHIHVKAGAAVGYRGSK